MLSDSSLYYNNDPARVLAELSHTAENDSSYPIQKLYPDSGFKSDHIRSENYGFGESACTVGYRQMKIDGNNTNDKCNRRDVYDKDGYI